MKISIVVPALNEAERLPDALGPLQEHRGSDLEIIVVDGGSTDRTREVASSLADRVVDAPRGRAFQMNAGARASDGATLVFLHADTVMPPECVPALREALATSRRVWGRFDLELSGPRRLLHFFALLIRWRSRLTGVATGDQAIFVRREAFERAGGYPQIPLMEDVALTKALRRRSWPLCLKARVTTSSRRWEVHGIWSTVLLMWSLRLAYFLGADPGWLARLYYGKQAVAPPATAEAPHGVGERSAGKEGSRG